ncbi:hypothetical protein LJC03_01770 [Methanobrevibacter sp. OttesenSCG-928-I08]|nr:hypothetical protein [Methanobrevibacter sp. OttesenSCG-928-I08]
MDLGMITIMVIRIAVIFLIIYAIVKNLKLLLFVALIIGLLLVLQAYYGFDLNGFINQVLYAQY